MIEKLKSRLQAAEMRTLRLIFGVTKRDIVRNVDIRRHLGLDPLLLEIERSQLRWFGHIQRMPPERAVKQIHQWRPNSRRPVGRPRLRWMDNISSIVDRHQLEVE